MRSAASILAVAAACIGLNAQPELARASISYLSSQFGVTAREVRTLDARRPVVRMLPASDKREIVSFGAIIMQASASTYIDRLRDIAAFKRGGGVVQIGVFSSTPIDADVQSLTLPASDKRELSRCRPGRCDVQLPADAIRRIAADLKSETRSADDDIDRMFRRELVSMVTSYRTLGSAGLPVYADTSSPTNTAEEFRRLVQSEPAILRRFDELYRHFESFPHSDAGIDDVIYWSRESLGPAEVVSVTHLAIQAVADPLTPVRFVAASRQLYSTHYFDASLGITLLLADGADPQRSVLVYVNRSRADIFGGMLGGFRRALVSSRLRSTMEQSLVTARALVEQAVGRAPMAR